ncbi:PREDICTED: universal stress protein A-like protein [Tarenaya hassleriana]|uniref:universal stress protein A-like protein n=1 Tax=Tarenaya hassleriana TaxID=28532 RepID=UPI00053C77FD|nr:PREDICTED: universal stress protein A-like protein [Tarenaya hassleriana]
MKKVMVVIDECNSSYDLLIWVLENLKDSIESSKLLIFAAQPLLASFTPPSAFSSSVGCAQMFFPFSANAELTWLAREKTKVISMGLLERAKKICADHGIKAETFTEAGDPKDIICRVVQEHMIDTLIISDQQNRNLTRSFMGGLSGYCSRNAECTVLVVKRET